MTWWNGRMVGLDLETTSPEPEEARIVTAAVVACGGGLPTEAQTWLADPGVEIPEGATAVHGITTEKARAEGQPADEVAGEVLSAVGAAILDGLPLIVFNARYDLTVLDREVSRHNDGERVGWSRLLVVDPFVIDKHLDRYRPSYVDPETGRKLTPEQATERGIPSSRTLAGMCEHYARRWASVTGRVSLNLLSAAHDASADALATVRLAYVMGALEPKHAVVRRVRNAEEGREKAALVRQWNAIRGDLNALHAFQAEETERERLRFAEYKRSVGDEETAAKVEAERGWPVHELVKVA